MRPLASAATMLPPVAFRQDLGVLRSAVLRYLPQLLQGGPAAVQLTGPFSKVGLAGGRGRATDLGPMRTDLGVLSPDTQVVRRFAVAAQAGVGRR